MDDAELLHSLAGSTTPRTSRVHVWREWGILNHAISQDGFHGSHMNLPLSL